MPEVADKYLKDVYYLAAAPKARVPIAEYRCKSVSPKVKGKGEHSVPNSHLCRSVEDHKDSHICICGYQWTAPTPNTKENAS